MHTSARWKAMFTAAACAVLLFTSHAQVTQQWVQHSTTSGFRATALDPSGNIYSAGWYHDGTVQRALLVKSDTAGTVLWSRTFLPGTSDTRGMMLAIDGNGDPIMSGSISGGQGFVVKYDAGGQLQWSQITSREGRQLMTDASNSVYALTSNGLTTSGELVKYSPTGVQLWAVSTPQQGQSRSGMALQGGFLYVTGVAIVTANGKGTQTQVAQTVKYHSSNGSQAWVANYAHADKRGQYGVDLAVDGAGNVYVLGSVRNIVSKNSPESDPNLLILKYNPSGVQQWVRIFDGNAVDRSCSPPCTGTPGQDMPRVIALDNSANVIVTGGCYTTTGAYTSLDMTTVKYNSAGTLQWARSYDGSQHVEDAVTAVKTSESGAVYVTGIRSLSTNEQDAITIKYTSAGTQEWIAAYDNGNRESAYDFALDAGGNGYMVGYAGPPSYAGILVKFSQSGTPKADARRGTVPEGVALEQNFPNPFNPSTTIRYTLPEEGPVRLTVYNVLGREVATLVNEVRSAGTHTAQLNAGGLESGLYTYELTVNGGRVSRTMLLLK